MTNKKILTLVSFLLLFSFLMVGCIPFISVNQPPEITSTPVTTATVDVEYIYNVVATDPNAGDVLTYSLKDEPTGMLINEDSGKITWTPTAAGSFGFTVMVTDEGGLFDDQDVTITVSAVELELIGIKVVPETMTLFESGVKSKDTIESVTAHFSDGSTADLAFVSCTFLSSDEDVAIVDAGVITAVEVGTANIIVSYEGKIDTLEVTVNPVLLTSIIVDPKTMTLVSPNLVETISSITACYNDESTAVIVLGDEACDYLSSDEPEETVILEVNRLTNVVTITGVANGTAFIYVSYTEGIITEEDTITVTVSGII